LEILEKMSFKNLISYSYKPQEDSDHENLNIGQCHLLNNYLRDLNNVKSEDWNSDSEDNYIHPIDTMIIGENMWSVRHIYFPRKNYIFTCNMCGYGFSVEMGKETPRENILRKPYKWRWNDAGYALDIITAEIFDKEVQHFDACHNTLPINWEENWQDSLAEEKEEKHQSEKFPFCGKSIGEKYIKCNDCEWTMKFYYSMVNGLYFDTITDQLKNVKQVHRRICNGKISEKLNHLK